MEKSCGYLRRRISEVLSKEFLGVLATQGEDGAPYTSLVGFAVGKNIESLYFATFSDTRKYRNITKNPDVSMLIDTRTNNPADFENSAALTAIGSASPSGAGAEIESVYLKKFPHLEGFISDPHSEVIELKVAEYIFVERFQNVSRLKIK